MKRGISHYDAGRYEKAELEFKNVLQLAQDNIDARYRLALTEEKLGRWKSAYYHFKKITQLDPKHVMAKVKLAELYLAAQVPDKALTLSNEIEVIDPGNSEILILRAKAHALKNELKLAMGFAQSAFDSDQKKSPESALLLADLHSKQRENEKGIEVLEEGIKYNPTDLQLKLSLANIYINQGNMVEAKTLLEKINQSPIENLSYRISLAKLFMRMDLLDESERVLRTAVKDYPDLSAKIALIEFLAKKRAVDAALNETRGFIEQFPKQNEFRFILASLYELNGEADKASSEYRKIIDKEKISTDGLKARRKLAALLMKAGDIKEAKTLVDEVLMQDALDHDARLLRATIFVTEGDIKSSISEINHILKREPDWIPALRLLASIHLQNNEPKLAEEFLQRAVNSDPKNIELQLQLVSLMEGQKDTARAIQQLEKALHDTPNHPWLLEALIKLQINAKLWDDAQKTIAIFNDTYPKTPKGNYLAGLMYQAKGNVKASREQFEKALQLQPTAEQPLTALIKSYLLENKGDLAIARIEKLLKDHPTLVFAHELLGEAQWSAKHYSDAEAAFRKAIELQPKWTLPYVNLGDMLLLRKQSKDAIRVYQQGIEKSSDSNVVHLKLCMAYEHLGQYDQAIREYEKILAQSPDFDIAINNLSMLLVAHKNDEESKKHALQLVQRFKDTDNLVFKDTMAWVYYKYGDIDSAISYLIDVVEKAPQVPEFHYHLGMAYYKKGYAKLARHHLEMALQDKGDFPGIEEARATLSTM